MRRRARVHSPTPAAAVTGGPGPLGPGSALAATLPARPIPSPKALADAKPALAAPAERAPMALSLLALENRPVGVKLLVSEEGRHLEDGTWVFFSRSLPR